VEEFDHHCKYVNNCIGRTNYAAFFRIVINLTVFLMLEFGQGLWVCLANADEGRWVGLSLVCLAGVVAIPLLYLAVFHCYISFWEYGTTLRYLRGENYVEHDKKGETKGELEGGNK
jgi:hypothetical protein